MGIGGSMNSDELKDFKKVFYDKKVLDRLADKFTFKKIKEKWPKEYDGDFWEWDLEKGFVIKKKKKVIDNTVTVSACGSLKRHATLLTAREAAKSLAKFYEPKLYAPAKCSECGAYHVKEIKIVYDGDGEDTGNERKAF